MLPVGFFSQAVQTYASEPKRLATWTFDDLTILTHVAEREIVDGLAITFTQ